MTTTERSEDGRAELLRDAIDALNRIAEGDEPRPLGKQWRKDGAISKNDQCVHGVWMYETCGNCISEYADFVVREISTRPSA
jgi:hypothetical protein